MQTIVENLPAEVVANASQILRTAHSLGLDERVKEIASAREDAI